MYVGVGASCELPASCCNLLELDEIICKKVLTNGENYGIIIVPKKERYYI